MQQVNVRSIYLNTGVLATSGAIHYFFAKNRELLRERNIFFPIPSDGLILHDQAGHHFLVQTALRSEKELDAAIQGICRALEAEASGRDNVTLVLSCPFLYRYPEAVLLLRKACCAAFPHAALHYFASFVPQYLEAEAYCGFMGLFSPQSIRAKASWMLDADKNLLDYYIVVRALQKVVGSAPLRIHANGIPESEGSEALSEFLRFMGIEPVALKEAGADFSSPSYDLFRLPHDFLEFSQYANSPEVRMVPLSGVLPWSVQAPLFMPEGDGVHSLFGLKLRRQFHAHYAESNILFARTIGGEVFPAPPDEPESEELSEMSAEGAYQVALRLDRQFAREVLRSFEACERPSSSLYYSCREALRAVLVTQRPLQSTSRKISVLTLAYNHEAYIAECIESVLAQKTTLPVEHVIVDDQSSDRTSEIIAAYAKKYPQIHPVYMPDKRMGENVRALFSYCDSQYVSLCDGDDYFTDPLKLQTQVDFLDANPHCGLCFHPVYVAYEDGTNRYRIYPPLEELPRGVRPFYYLSDLLKFNLIQTNSVMYRWRFRHGLPDWFDVKLLPGDWYWHLLHAETGKIGFINKIMSVYRRHTSSLYYSSEVDRLVHRRKYGIGELQLYDTVNKHFQGRYKRGLVNLANSVFGDLFVDAQRTDDYTFFDEATEAFPEFAMAFLSELKILRARRGPGEDETVEL